MTTDKFLVGERVLLTLWVGGMWAIGFMAVPTLFSMLDDRQLAGMLAGQMFKIMYIVGFAVSLVLLVSVFINQGMSVAKQWRTWILTLAFVLIALGLFVLQPAMQEIKAQGMAEGSAQAERFATLHKASSTMYTVTSLCGLVLVVSGLRRRAT